MHFWNALKNKQFYLSIIFAAVLFGSLQYSVWGQFADPDGFYHAKASQILQAGKLTDSFPWMQYTTWKDNYADQHYLYHWLLVPFNYINNLQFSIIFFSLIFVILFWYFLSAIKVSYKPVWLIIMLAGSVDFLFRINLVKANTLSLALLCAIGITTYYYHKKAKPYLNLGLIALLSGVFVWTYGGFVVVPLFLVAYSTALLLTEKKIDIWPVIVSVGGIALGLLLHPHSNHFLKLMYDQLFRTGLGAGSVVPAGNEWLPFNLDWFFKSNALVLLPWFISLGLEFHKALKKESKVLAIWLHIVALGFVILTLWHRRFVEYWEPFAVLAAAKTLHGYIKQLKWKEIKYSIGVFWQVRLLIIALSFFAVFCGAFTIKQVHESLAGGDASNKYKDAASWISQNSQPGDLVLNTQWDQFPQLFYWNSKNYYMVGLDPTFMYLYNKDLYWDWRKVADDHLKDWESIEQLHDLIANKLKAKYIFIDTSRNTNLYNFIMENDPEEKYFSAGFSSADITVVNVK